MLRIGGEEFYDTFVLVTTGNPYPNARLYLTLGKCNNHNNYYYANNSIIIMLMVIKILLTQ